MFSVQWMIFWYFKEYCQKKPVFISFARKWLFCIVGMSFRFHSLTPRPGVSRFRFNSKPRDSFTYSFVVYVNVAVVADDFIVVVVVVWKQPPYDYCIIDGQSKLKGRAAMQAGVNPLKQGCPTVFLRLHLFYCHKMNTLFVYSCKLSVCLIPDAKLALLLL